MPLATLVLLLASATPAQGPVAVLPFKNLSADAQLTWLELGMAETLMADLKRARSVQVVERSEVEKALAQVAMKAAEEDRAAQVGKLVAAKTVVLGSFQRAGAQVRIVARFVSVETGVVTDAARATGALESVFEVQDQLVTALLGAPPAPARHGRPAKALRAFERYGRALAAKDDGEKKILLQAAVKEDPEFSYAVEDLAALEGRLAGYAKTSNVQLAAAEKALLAKIENAKLAAADRLAAAAQLLDGLEAARRFNALADTAKRLQPYKDLQESAAWALFAARLGLHRYDEALGAGERFLKDFPTSPRFKTVESRMREVVNARKKREGRKAEYAADLADKKKDCKGALECDYAPCICARWSSQVGQLMLEACSGFLSAHAKDKGDDAAEKIAAARYFVALSLVEQGEWKKASAMINELEQSPVRECDDDIAALRSQWPADQAP
jgi:TolB-like protein